MGSFLTTLATVLLLCGIGIAQADEQTDKLTNVDATIGIGMICNTSEQAERYISLLGAGQRAEPAMQAVNSEVKNPRACGIAAVAFTRGATVDTKRVHGKLMQVVRIKVIAGFDGVSWQPATGMQYAVIELTGMEI